MNIFTLTHKITAICVICYVLLVESNAKMNNSWPLPKWFSATSQQSSNKPKLTVPTFLNYGGNILPIGAIAIVQLQLAVDATQKAGLLNDYDVSIRAYDDMCDHAVGVDMVLHLLNTIGDEAISKSDPSFHNMVPATIGPLCAYQAYTANVYKHYNFLMLVGGAAVRAVYRDRKTYEAIYSMYPSYEALYDALPAFLKSNNWNNVYLLTETYPFWTPLEDQLTENLSKLNITLKGMSKVIFPDAVPEPALFELATAELAARDPRIIIVHSNFGSLLACWLHRQGLYGPKYVYVMNMLANFLPNSPLRPQWCTDRMLFDVLQSVIIFTFGFPVNLYPEAIDSLGIRGRDFLENLKTEMDHPDLSENWFYWKGMIYDQTIAGLVLLDSVDKELKSSNDSLLNWVTSSKKFLNNGSYIYSMMKRKSQNLRYNGTYRIASVDVNSIHGLTAFHQVQAVTEVVTAETDLTSLIKIIPVAVYDSASPVPVVRQMNQLKWRTVDGLPPYDLPQLFLLMEPVIPNNAEVVLLSFAALLLFSNIILMIVNCYKGARNPKVQQSLPVMNSLILLGNALVTCFVLLMAVGASPVDNSRCLASVLLLVVGFSIVTSALGAKLEIAVVATRTGITPVPSLRTGLGSRITVSPHCHQLTTIQSDLHASSINQRGVVVTASHRKFGIVFVIAWSMLQLLILAIWFISEPLVIAHVNRQLVIPNKDSGISYQHFTRACSIKPNSTMATGFIGTLIFCYALCALRTIYLAYLLRKHHKSHSISDLQESRMAAYAMTLLTFAGGGAIVAFFRGDPGNLQVAICTLALLVVGLVVTIMFVTKFRKGIYL